ncbi:hypothetical protein ASF40_13170 [Microbacterium sp. Leaf288]|uniref:hypothetical protein n=1 Tax=Microbacterium sp. Leaf288 TaxID=1736323 RepID=UPI0006F337B7|nr:hypothetical protein [Microbacterium sp. Leaf288]KQP70687.1 hypothetical protein ASF40_13170 [Microbacterium sp. Leaf288]
MAAAAASPVRAQTILDLADAARGEAPIPRALRVAAAAGEDTAGLREAPLGHLHAAALGFHTALTGPRLEAVVTCPACASAVEFALDADSLRGLSGTAASGDLTVPTQAGAWRVRWRVPTAGDLAEVAGRTDAAATLLARCCDVTGPSGEDATLAPVEVVEHIEAALAAADPLAEVTVGLDCPECGALFDADVDPIAFVWHEVESRARRVLREVDVLARAYGWTEADVLALPEQRRAAYLEIVREGA